jgi:hypothetical protein
MNLVQTVISHYVYKCCGVRASDILYEGLNKHVSLPKLYYADSHFWCFYLLYDTFLKRKVLLLYTVLGPKVFINM